MRRKRASTGTAGNENERMEVSAMVITQREQFQTLTDGNRLVGTAPELTDSRIELRGKGNILVCHPSVRLEDSRLRFWGDNSIIYLCSTPKPYRLHAAVHTGCVLCIGRDNYFNNTLTVLLSEGKHCVMGNDCIVSHGVWIRNTDTHLVYSARTGTRVNLPQSIFVGDHVWIGQGATLLKGTRVDSGSIIGAMSLVAGKRIGANESWGGNPARRLSADVFWDRSCVHNWQQEQTEASMDFAAYAPTKQLAADAYIYTYREDRSVSYADIDKRLSSGDRQAVVAYLDALTANDDPARFVHADK